MSMVNVFHFFLDPRYGGPHAYVNEIKKNDFGDDFQFIYIAPGGRDKILGAQLFIRQITLYLLPIEVIINSIIIIINFKFRYKNKKSIFNIHGIANIAPAIAALFLNVKVVWHVHETDTRYSRIAKWMLILGSMIDAQFVSVSKCAIDLYKIPNCELIRGPADASFWAPPKSAHRVIGWEGRQIRLVCVGNVNSLKGYDILLAALRDLDINFKLKIVGTKLKTQKKFNRKINEMKRNFDSSNTVEFLGFRSAAEIREIFWNSDLFVLPSRSEACPLVLLEAMLSNVPCLATPVGDVPYILGEGERGFLARDVSIQSVKNALSSFLSAEYKDIENRIALAEEFVRQEHSPVKAAKANFEIYRKLMEKA